MHKKIEFTPMLIRYMLKLAIRLAIFIIITVLYIWRREWLMERAFQPVRLGITPVHILWVYFMLIMISHLIPMKLKTMALKKMRRREYVEAPGYSRLEMYEYIQKQNVAAWQVLLVWMSLNAVIAILYLSGILVESDLIYFTVCFFLSDYICILFFCPFQSGIMHNKCCVNCRIFDWGHFMMFTPMLFIRNFFTWSLFFTSLVVLIHWEIGYARHPERFWEGSNQKLRCANCTDKTCQLKTNVAGLIGKKGKK